VASSVAGVHATMRVHEACSACHLLIIRNLLVWSEPLINPFLDERADLPVKHRLGAFFGKVVVHVTSLGFLPNFIPLPYLNVTFYVHGMMAAL
jgi:hypothetical protein